MEKIKEFVKENWIWIVGGILLATIILYLANRKQKKDILKNPGGAINKGKLVPTTETLDVASLKAKLDECNKKNANVRIGGGAVGPCGLLQDQYNAALKNTESSYGGKVKLNPISIKQTKTPTAVPLVAATKGWFDVADGNGFIMNYLVENPNLFTDRKVFNAKKDCDKPFGQWSGNFGAQSFVWMMSCSKVPIGSKVFGTILSDKVFEVEQVNIGGKIFNMPDSNYNMGDGKRYKRPLFMGNIVPKLIGSGGESSYSYNTRAVSKKPRMCKYPDGTPVPCDAMELSYGGGQFAGAFDKTNGLNVTDFAMGMEGTALLEDKNL